MLGMPWLFSQQMHKQQCAHDNKNLRCVRYISNYDGDTIRFHIKDVHPLFGDNLVVRLSGLHTPQLKSGKNCEKTKAIQAKTFVKKALRKARQIDLRNIRRSRYFGLIANVEADGKRLGDLLVAKGLGYVKKKKDSGNLTWCREPTAPSAPTG